MQREQTECAQSETGHGEFVVFASSVEAFPNKRGVKMARVPQLWHFFTRESDYESVELFKYPNFRQTH